MLHLLPAFGKLRPDAIKVREIDRFRAAKMKTHSAKTVNNMLAGLQKEVPLNETALAALREHRHLRGAARLV